ncbi:stage IV sporulation protein B [Sporobacter termitidis DSM 10068]|uniref:Stage IV sporulation protein B n=1 Tax=Sporobacter termitidis DSM 10068 TaxID=1123282 RepID=A0A1M5Y971_9FIRM|nr:SpoIVB peptidase [Sporobacter termitidis]SHI08384.1 stage IV sporulation protein B [Sporobacter termitidis DSM 10068]
MESCINRKKKLIKRCVSGLLLLTFLSFGATGGLAAYEGKTLIPMGNAVGINIQSEGVMVAGVPEVLSDGQTASPARGAGLSAGDIITQIGSAHVSSTEDLKAAISKLDGSPVPIKISRGSNILNIKVTPHKCDDGHCELGLWMRDGIAGIGTLTFYDPETKTFGALGHAVNDIETGVIIPLRAGSVMRSVVTDVIQGKAGMPGQLRGTFNIDSILGTLTENSSSGIFGKMEGNDLMRGKAALPVAQASEIKTGPATILSNVSGTDVTEYKVEITRVYTGSEAVGRSMMLSVTDPALIAQTGGIVQGMSGSPIIQNGKLIGAVTHVLVNDPTRGYGISIENMLDTIGGNSKNKAA